MPTARPTVRPLEPTPPGTAPHHPPARDVSVDVVRAACILAVVVGHWLVVVPSYRDGRFDGVNALGTVPLMRGLTWIFQVMPLFFVVGGVANLASWRLAVARGETYGRWLEGRVRRLLHPTLILVGTWATAGVVLRAAGVDAELVRLLAWLVVVPVWFLAVYLLVVTAAPLMARLHQRFGSMVVVALGAGAVLVDGARIGAGWEAVGYLNFLLVFLLAQQLGFWWMEGRLQGRTIAVGFLVGGSVALWLATHAGPYPVSLVGVPGEAVANNAPPTATLVALGFAQTGLALLVRARLIALVGACRPVAAATVALNRHAMTVLLWHFSALILGALVVLPLGLLPEPATGGGAWWALRVGAVVLWTAPLVGLVALFGRFERARPVPAAPVAVADPGRDVAAWRPVAAAVTGAVACSMITLGGLSTGGPVALGLPVVPVAVLALAGLLAGGRR